MMAIKLAAHSTAMNTPSIRAKALTCLKASLSVILSAKVLFFREKIHKTAIFSHFHGLFFGSSGF